MKTSTVPWYALRARVATDDAALAAAGYSDWPSSGVLSMAPSGANEKLAECDVLQIAFYGTDADNEDSAYSLFGRKKMNGPILHLATGVVTLGGMACAVDPITGVAITNGFFADTITITSGVLAVYDPVIVNNADHVAMLQFPKMGLEDIHVRFDLDGGSTASASMGAIISGIVNGDPGFTAA